MGSDRRARQSVDRDAAQASLADITDRVAVNRASRIMACGWGGQTVVSDDAVKAFGTPPDGQLDDAWNLPAARN